MPRRVRANACHLKASPTASAQSSPIVKARMFTSAVRRAWPILVAFLTGYAASVEGQSFAAHSSLTLVGGIATGGSGTGAVLVGLEFRTPELGRLSAAAAGSIWYFVGVGCDAIVGAPCDTRARTFDIGPVVRLTPRGRSWRLEATTRVGGLWYRGKDRGVWNPSVGLGFGWGELRRLGGLLGLRYHALTSNRPSTLPYRPGTDDHLVASAGIQLRF